MNYNDKHVNETEERERKRWGGIVEINLCDLQDVATNWGKSLGVWEYDCTINDNWEIRRKILPGEENNYFLSTYIKYSFLVCHPGVQLQLELWNKKRDRAMVIGISLKSWKPIVQM